uniref:Si:dkey-42p14.3 n=1 Tax=Myripristis murdjan TaxID=586833 RepID=A0A667Y004_9TELE
MATPREKEAADYLEKHKIIELFDNLTSMLFFHRPENPREFLIEKLEQLRSSKLRRVPGPSLFDSSNVDALFGILDPSNQGHITFAQYKEGEYRTRMPLVFCTSFGAEIFVNYTIKGLRRNQQEWSSFGLFL